MQPCIKDNRTGGQEGHGYRGIESFLQRQNINRLIRGHHRFARRGFNPFNHFDRAHVGATQKRLPELSGHLLSRRGR